MPAVKTTISGSPLVLSVKIVSWIYVVAIQARSAVLHDPDKGFLSRAMRELRAINLIDKHLAVAPVHMKTQRARFSGISQLLVSRLEEFYLICFCAGGAKAVAGVAVDCVEVTVVEAVMKEFDCG